MNEILTGTDKMHLEAEIKIIREGEKLNAISVTMPIWSKESQGNLRIKFPLLGIETFAKDEEDSDDAIREALISFCIVSEKFGQGVERELQTLGWIHVDGQTGEPVLGYNVADSDSLIERLMQTGENYVNDHIEIEEEKFEIA